MTVLGYNRPMRPLGLGLSTLLFLAACGGGDDGAGVVPDAPRAPDAEVPADSEIVADAEPAPDATITADLGCADDPLPTTGTDPIVITGHAGSASISGMADLQGATIEAFATGNVTALDSDTSDVNGDFSLTIANAALTPVNGYVKGVNTGYLDSYLYPPFPLAADTDQAPLLFITQTTMGQLGFVSGTTQSASLGFVGVLVLDCAGNPVENATVTVSPTDASTKVVYVGTNNIPDAAATHTAGNGLAFVFNAPTSDLTVDASAGGNSLREHVITARAGAVTSTAVGAGPVAP